MKKFMSGFFAVALLAGISMAATNEVTSVNIVGYSRVTLTPAKFHLLALNFDALSSTSTLMTVFSTNTIRAGSNPNSSDNLWLWNPSTQKYRKYYLGTDLSYHYTTNDTVVVDDDPVAAGDALWIKAASGLPTNTIALMGQVVDVATQATSVVKFFNMISYGFSSDTKLGDLNITTNQGATADGNPSKADQVYLWDVPSQRYVKCCLLPVGGWFYVTNTDVSASNVVISVSDGFWYLARTNFVWSETNKYIGNL